MSLFAGRERRAVIIVFSLPNTRCLKRTVATYDLAGPQDIFLNFNFKLKSVLLKNFERGNMSAFSLDFK